MFAYLNRMAWKVSLLTTVISLLVFTGVLAAPGDLDTTFSGDGKVTTDISGGREDRPQEIALQTDGKIVVVGERNDPVSVYDSAVARYNPNGDLETTFSGDGKVNVGFASGPQDLANDLALQPDGKIVMSGHSCDTVVFENRDFAVLRLNANGTLDTTFSGDGMQTIDLGGNEGPEAIAVQSNGKIVVAGSKWTPRNLLAVVRLKPNGSLDTTFSGDGRVVTSFGPGVAAGGGDVRIQLNGKVIAAGVAGGDFAVVRYNLNGTLDTTFSKDGKVRVDFGSDETGAKLALQSNGRYVLAGYTQGNFALARVLP